MRWRLAFTLLGLLGFPVLAGAEPLRAVYGVQAAGMQVMQVEVLFDLSRPSHYRIESNLRFTGMAGWFSGGRQVNRVEGIWAGGTAQPIRFMGDGMWRGEPRRVVIDYTAGEPVLRVLVPSDDGEREPVPQAMQQGTIDSLSALAQLTRNLAETGRCEGSAAIFDGRRRADLRVRTLGRDHLPPWRDAWSGEAVRCGFTGRQVAGFRRGESAEVREPQEGTAWMASPRPGAPMLPVRVEIPSRWLGSLTGYLTEIGPP